MMAGFLLVACTDDLVVDSKSAFSMFDESDIMETPLAVSVNEFAVSTSGTRAEGDPDNEEPTDDKEIMSDFEKAVDNIWVFQYDTSGNLVIKPRYYTAEESETDGTWHVLLKPVKSSIYVVTNVNDSSWALNDDFMDVMTIDKLMEATLSEPYTIYDLSSTATEGHIPMQGCTTEEVTPVSGGPAIIVPVEHMYAKVKVRIIIDKLLEPYEPIISSVEAENCPWYCRIGTLYDKTVDSQDKEYPTHENAWVSRSMMKEVDGEEVGNNTDDPNNIPLEEEGETPYEYVIYIPENIQGEVTTVDTDANAKADNLPEGHPTSVVVGIKYYTVSSSGDRDIENEAHYTVYPGGNSYNNFNIRRNQVYRVSMTLGAPETEHIPSANCIVGHPGKTISFEPYYRVETGGGYDFTDYLDPVNNPIKGYKILWQTENCIGDNSDGSLVTFELDESDVLHSKFYVHVNQPGNAVIAAYNDADCEGEIIWSWHIWVTSEDPTNISNAITYYTYAWDENGIYGVNSGRASIPGYGMMSCNLGALASVPTAATGEGATSTYGLLYQWGRKDPFPALKGAASGTYSYTEYGEYTENTTELLYDNDNKRITGMTDEANSNVLFHSVTATEIINNEYDVPFSIKNPTVFMCGTELAAQRNSDYVAGQNTPASYTAGSVHYPAALGGDWHVNADPKLWGATPITEDTKCLEVGTDRSGDTAHLYDDYGEKSIFDPCPYGWRVSPPDQWLSFTDDGSNPSSTDYGDKINYESVYGYGMYMYIQSWRQGLTSYFPTQGTRAPDGSGGRPRRCGNYHNATADEGVMQRVNILHIHNGGDFNIFELGILAYYVKSVAGPVRCVRDKK